MGDAIKNGLELVEQEMPASISFHVPDQYHKRIIGIGGQHIQRIMKRYSVFVKFSNAMDRGAHGRDDEDIKVDNVICRTPTRNAQNLELVKQEIMDMVEKVDAEFVNETVSIDRLYQRDMIKRMPEIEQLEKKWNCKITFPNPEEASNNVTISGPEYQIPHAVDGLLGMVPESHELAFSASADLKAYIRSPEFKTDVVEPMRDQHCLEVRLDPNWKAPADLADPDCLVLSYTRNNAGGLKDAIDALVAKLVAKGLDAETVKGAIPRPKSDSFEDSLPFFESKILHQTKPSSTDSPTRSNFGDVEGESSSFFSKFRNKPGMSSFSSLIERRRNGTNSPSSSLFKHASSNASKASLASLESVGSFSRHPWNDSGINLPEEEGGLHHLNGNGWHHPPPSSHSMTNGKFPSFGTLPTSHANGSVSSLGPPPMAGDTTPTSRYDPRGSVDSGRPSTSHSFNNATSAASSSATTTTGYPGPIGPPR